MLVRILKNLDQMAGNSFYRIAQGIKPPINGNELADLILKYYEQLSPKYRKLIPLKKVYMPVFGTDEE